MTPGTEWRTCSTDSTEQVNTGRKSVDSLGSYVINRFSACKATDSVDAVHNWPVNTGSWVTNLALCSHSTLKTLWIHPSMIQWMIWVDPSVIKRQTWLVFRAEWKGITGLHWKTFLIHFLRLKNVLLLKHFSTLCPSLLSVSSRDHCRQSEVKLQPFNSLLQFYWQLNYISKKQPLCLEFIHFMST